MKIAFVLKQGNISKLAAIIAKEFGGDTNFFAKCMACSKLKEYDPERRKIICARAKTLIK